MRMRAMMMCLWAGTALAACGGGQTQPNEPASEGTEDTASAPESLGGGDGGAFDEPATQDTEASESAAEPEPVRSPKDILTAPGVLFVFSFNASEAYKKAEDKCDKKAGDDPQKKAECMTKARKPFNEIGDITFKKDDEDKWWWLTVSRKGGTLKALHKIEVEFEESGNSVTLKTKGRDKGSKPRNVPKEVVIEVPSESEIVLTDPKHGKMVYQAKLGLFGEAKR